MPFWKKKKSKQQKSTAKKKPTVAPVKPLPKTETFFSAAQVRTTEDSGLYFGKRRCVEDSY